MKYTDLIFDLYGTLVDIHTEENDLVWEKTALYFGFYGAQFTGAELRNQFQSAMQRREAQAGQTYECFPDIPFELVMAELFRSQGITENADTLGINAALKTNDHIIIFGKQIDHTAFSFVTPVDSYDCTVCHFSFLRYICSVRRFITSA